MKKNRDEEKKTIQKEDFEEVSNIRMGNAKIPRFLIGTYIVLAIWAVAYAFLAHPINERTEDATGKKPVDGKMIVQQHCLGCHHITNEKLIGPGLQGVGSRLSNDQLTNILINGRGSMPSLSNQGLDTQQIQAVQKYLQTL